MRLKGKVALITGAASGIGRASALVFAAEGARVMVADIDEAGAQETVARVSAAGAEARAVHTDVSSFASVESAVALCAAHFGALDVMFNNAGSGHFAPLLAHEPPDYDRVVRINQYGVYHGILAAARYMTARGTQGVILNTSSVLAHLGSVGVIGYHAAKGAVRSMTQAAALELAPYGIRVVALAPGGVDTPIIQGYKDLGLGPLLAQQQLRGVLQTPEQIARVAAFLASDDAQAINGVTVLADDGYTAFKSALPGQEP